VQAKPYIACMKNRDLPLNPYPTTAELYALERAAHAARAAEMARLVRAAVRGVKTLFTAPEASKELKGLKHA
jgi:hypothetical protein